jgi:cell division protein FtsB
MEARQQRRIAWITAVVLAFLLFGNSGFQSMVSQISDMRRLQKNLVRLRAEREVLAKELAAIQQDPAYTEYLIRKNLGYIKKGEYEYRLMKPKSESR